MIVKDKRIFNLYIRTEHKFIILYNLQSAIPQCSMRASWNAKGTMKKKETPGLKFISKFPCIYKFLFIIPKNRTTEHQWQGRMQSFIKDGSKQ